MYTKRVKKDSSENKVWDVVVVGGGAAGMMAAATAASAGATVLLLEKNDSLGKKLRISGGGRCNVTNNKPNVRTMLSMYKGKGKFLFSTFTQHGVAESIDWFFDRKVPFKEENEQRLFPITNSAETIYNTLLEELTKTKVTVTSNAVVTGIEKTSNGTFFIASADKKTFFGKKCIVATGGVSRPETGSTGDGYVWLRKMGHTIKKNDLALVPLVSNDRWVRKLSGTTLTDIKLTVQVDGEVQFSETGKILFTHTGVSGPTILNMSKQVSELLESGTVTISIDCLPKQDVGAVRTLLTALLQTNSNKLIRNVLPELVPRVLANILLDLCGTEGDTPCHSVRVEDKKKLSLYLKNLPVTISGLMGSDKAVVSSGGVAPEEIQFKTMESKLVPGLYVIGDMLDIDRPSGGYSLQLCWSTGFVAGTNAATS